MATRTRKFQISILNDRIDILGRTAAESSPTKKVFNTVGAILALVRVGALVLRLSVIYANSQIPLMTWTGQVNHQQRFYATF